MYLVPASKATLPLSVVRGRSLAHRKLKAPQKAAIAAGILNGEMAIELSACQLAHLIGVSAPYISAALKLAPEVRRSIADGRGSLSFTFLLKWRLPEAGAPAPQIVNIA